MEEKINYKLAFNQVLTEDEIGFMLINSTYVDKNVRKYHNKYYDFSFESPKEVKKTMRRVVITEWTLAA